MQLEAPGVAAQQDGAQLVGMRLGQQVLVTIRNSAALRSTCALRVKEDGHSFKEEGEVEGQLSSGCETGAELASRAARILLEPLGEAAHP